MTTPASLEHEYTLATAVARYDELRMQDLLAPGADDLPAEDQPGLPVEAHYKWARYSHPNKPARWVIACYFGKFNKSRQDQWVFGDRDSGAYLLRFSWTKIVRHQMVREPRLPTTPP